MSHQISIQVTYVRTPDAPNDIQMNTSLPSAGWDGGKRLGTFASCLS